MGTIIRRESKKIVVQYRHVESSRADCNRFASFRGEGRGPAPSWPLGSRELLLLLLYQTWLGGELEFDPPPLPLLQNGYSRATAFRTSPFTRVNGSRVLEFIRSIKIEANGSLSRAKEKHIYIYIYTSGTRIYSWWVPVQIVTSLTVLLVLPIRISSPSLSPYSDIFARVRICEPDDMS